MLGLGVRYRILGEIERITREARAHGLKGAETGGWLLADRRWPDHVVMATGPGDTYVTETEVTIKTEVFEELERRHPHLAAVGDWHLHPNHDPVPSTTDRRAWMCGCKLRRGFWASVVATLGQGLYAEPQLTGWITCGAGEHMFCEPLRLRVI